MYRAHSEGRIFQNLHHILESNQTRENPNMGRIHQFLRGYIVRYDGNVLDNYQSNNWAHQLSQEIMQV